MPDAQFDNKGKIFTDVISKESVTAVIQTLTHQIRGFVHVRPGERLKDEMNTSAEQFLAVTDAMILNAHGEDLFHCDFLAVNRDHIVWLLPQEGIQEYPAQPPGGSS